MVEFIRSVTIYYNEEPVAHLEITDQRTVRVHALQLWTRIWFPKEPASFFDLERFLHTRHIPKRDTLFEKRYLNMLGLIAWDPLALLVRTRGVMAADPLSLHLELTPAGQERVAALTLPSYSGSAS